MEAEGDLCGDNEVGALDKGIPGPRGGIYFVSYPAQLVDMLPDRRPGDMEPPAELLSRNTTLFLQCPENGISHQARILEEDLSNVNRLIFHG